MARRTKNVEIHNFGCMNCGKFLPLARKMSLQKEKLHRKKLFCPFCKCTVNMVETRNYNEKLEFISKFEEGCFLEEARESMEICKYE